VKRWLTVLMKEVTENLRDRRTMMTTFVVSPLLGPVLVAALFGFMLNMERERAEKPLEIPIVGAEFAPNFVSWLEQQDIKIEAPPKDPEKAIRNRDEDVVIRLTPEFPEQWRRGESAVLELLFDPSRQTASQTVARTQGLIESYSRQIGAMRLMLRGVNPEVARPVEMRALDLSTPQSRGGQLLMMLPALLFMTVFMGGMSMAIDATAGERERQSLEPLLANPMPRGEIMLGKMMASTSFALASSALSLIIYLIGFKLIPMEQFGMSLSLTLTNCGVIFIALIPLAVLASAAQTALAAFSKSFREAQTQVGLLMMIPYLPGMLLAVNPIKPILWYYSVPFFGQIFVLERIFRGESIEWVPFWIAFASSSVVALITLWFAARMYHRESLAVSA
jgi:sodium transport system permease protein